MKKLLILFMENNLNNCITYILIVILSFLTSCHDMNEGSCNEEMILSGEVKEAIIEHFVDTKNESDFSRISFIVEFTNCTDKIQSLLFTYYRDEFEREIPYSNIKISRNDELVNSQYISKGINHNWLIMRDSLFFAVEKKDSLTKLQKGETKLIKVRGMFPIIGNSLKWIYAGYKPFLYADFKMLYELGDCKFELEKSTNFEIKMFVDDTLVTINDSLQINKMKPPPNFRDTIPDLSIPETDLEVDILFK